MWSVQRVHVDSTCVTSLIDFIPCLEVPCQVSGLLGLRQGDTYLVHDIFQLILYPGVTRGVLISQHLHTGSPVAYGVWCLQEGGGHSFDRGLKGNGRVV